MTANQYVPFPMTLTDHQGQFS